MALAVGCAFIAPAGAAQGGALGRGTGEAGAQQGQSEASAGPGWPIAPRLPVHSRLRGPAPLHVHACLAAACARVHRRHGASPPPQVNSLKAKLDGLVAQFEEARDEKQRIEDQARKTQDKLNLAERLVNGLADENVRWAGTIEELTERTNLLIGDVLLAAAFISYIGPFSRAFRDDLVCPPPQPSAGAFRRGVCGSDVKA